MSSRIKGIRPGAKLFVVLAHLQIYILSNGAPTIQSHPWILHTIDDTSLGADGVRSDDVNGDGMPDLVASWEQGDIARVYLMKKGEGRIPKWQLIDVGEAPNGEDAVFFDADSDGFVDVISSTEGDFKKILVHWAPNNWHDYGLGENWHTKVLYENGSQWMFTIPMDVDGKHGTDLVIGGKHKGATIGWLECPANPRETRDWKYHKMDDAGWIMSLILEDMDSDGDLDVLLSDRYEKKRGVRWLENPGKGSDKTKGPWKNHWIGQNLPSAMFIDLHDIDGDGSKEVAAPYFEGGDHHVSVFKQVDSNSSNWREFPLEYPQNMGRPKSTTMGDIDRDGLVDIVVSTETAWGDKRGIVWFKNPGSLEESKWEVYDVSGPDGIKFDMNILLDVDGDGDLDILNTEEGQNDINGNAGLGVFWYENPDN